MHFKEELYFSRCGKIMEKYDSKKKIMKKYYPKKKFKKIQCKKHVSFIIVLHNCWKSSKAEVEKVFMHKWNST
jgi:hypothetical protein